MAAFNMPSLGADMEAGTLVEWLVQPGDAISRGDIIAVVETQKGAIEIEVFDTGVVQSLDAEIGQKIPVGQPIAVIRSEGEERAEATKPATPSGDQTEPKQNLAEVRKPPVHLPVTPSDGLAASPAARKKAQELKIDLNTVTGTGPDGAVILDDIEPAAPDQGTVSSGDRAETEMRRAIAETMSRSKREIPHFYLSVTTDIQNTADWLSAQNASRLPADRMLLGALLFKAIAFAAMKVPQVNGHYIKNEFAPAEKADINMIVALRRGGLVAPSIRDVAHLSLADTMQAIRDVVSRARSGKLRSSDMAMGTLTVSSLGETGAETMAGVIFPPQVALVCIGAPQVRPWVVDGSVVARKVVTLTLSADHRVIDGRIANRFLTEITSFIQKPEAL